MKVTNKVTYPVKEVPRLSVTVSFKGSWWVCYSHVAVLWWRSPPKVSSNHYYIFFSEPLLVFWCKEKPLQYSYLCLASKVRKSWAEQKCMGEAPCLPIRAFILFLFPAAMQSNWFSQQHEDKLSSLPELMVSKQKVKWAKTGVKCQLASIRCVSRTETRNKNFCWNNRRYEEGMPLKPVSQSRFGIACRRGIPKDFQSRMQKIKVENKKR